MTVSQLIRKLKKMPQNAKVYTADHDHAACETNGPVFSVDYIDQSKEDISRLESVFLINEPYVTIRA